MQYDLVGVASGHYQLRFVDGTGSHSKIGKLVVR
jgi:hypothetical protein